MYITGTISKSRALIAKSFVSKQFQLQNLCTTQPSDDEKEKELERIAKDKSRALIAKSFVSKQFQLQNLCTTQPSDDEKEKELERIAKDASIDQPPTTCCQSGCSNCVYIAWAEALTAKMQSGSPEIIDKIMTMVEDPSMRAYLEMELRLRGLKNQ